MSSPSDLVKSSTISELEDHAQAIRTLGKRVIADIIEIGRHLAEARKLCGHGQWLPWLEREFAWADDTAGRFRSIYEMAKSRNLRNLDLPVSALYLLAKSSTPPAVREEVLARAESGERVSHKEVAATIAQAKAVAPAAQDRTKPLGAAEKVAAIDASDMSDAEKARAFYHMAEQGKRMMADATRQLGELEGDQDETPEDDDETEDEAPWNYLEDVTLVRITLGHYDRDGSIVLDRKIDVDVQNTDEIPHALHAAVHAIIPAKPPCCCGAPFRLAATTAPDEKEECICCGRTENLMLFPTRLTQPFDFALCDQCIDAAYQAWKRIRQWAPKQWSAPTITAISWRQAILILAGVDADESAAPEAQAHPLDIPEALRRRPNGAQH
jgi:hypothetical protein